MLALTAELSAVALWRLMRPEQWVKNLVVLAGFAFGAYWRDPAISWNVLLAFAAFCAVSSLVYIVNDWQDRHTDALHPTKRHRPLAAGQVRRRAAALLGALLFLLALALARHNPALLVLLALYVLINLAYSTGLRQVPVVDVCLIAAGFVLRLLAGTWAVGIAPSRWLLLTGVFLALYLGFCKRKAESLLAVSSQRAVLLAYPAALLDTFMASTMTASITMYSLFATSPEALQAHGNRLIYTVPLVIFSLLRYAYQVHRGLGENVVRDLWRDPWIVGAALAWALLVWGWPA